MIHESVKKRFLVSLFLVAMFHTHENVMSQNVKNKEGFSPCTVIGLGLSISNNCSSIKHAIHTDTSKVIYV